MYQNLLNDKTNTILKNSEIGLPDLTDENRGTYKGVVFTSEEPVISKAVMQQIFEWEGLSSDFKAVICGPISQFVNKEKKVRRVVVNSKFKSPNSQLFLYSSLQTYTHCRRTGCPS